VKPRRPGTDSGQPPAIAAGPAPARLHAGLAAAGLDPADALFAIRGDLRLDGADAETWLVVTATAAVAVMPGHAGSAAVAAGPFGLAGVKKVRTFQTVGSAFLQVLIEGAYVDLIRYSNGCRERFGRGQAQLERLLRGEQVLAEALLRPSETICPRCSLPLPGPRAACPRCAGRKGIFARTLGLMRPYRFSILMLLMLLIGGVCLDLLPPQLTRYMVDRVLNTERAADAAPGPAAEAAPPAASAWQALRRELAAPRDAAHPLSPRDRLWLLMMILVGLATASATRHTINVFIGRTSSIVGTRITRELREKLQSKLIGLSVEYYNRHSVGSLMSRVLYDVDIFQQFVQQVAHGFLLNLLLVLGIGAMLFSMNARLAVFVLLPIPFVVVGTTFFWKHVYPRHYRLWDSQSKTAQLLTGLLQGIRLVKVFGQEEREKERFSAAAGYMQQARRGVETSIATFNPIMGFVFGLGGLIIWFAGGKLVLQAHDFTLGTLMAFFAYIGMFYGPVSALSMFSNWVTGFLSAGQRVFEVLDSTLALPEDPHPVRRPRLDGAIEFRNVTFGYDPYRPILKNVSLRVEPGQFVGIVGKSGSGKTTLVNLICRFYDVQEGQVLLDGIDVCRLAAADIHRNVGLVLQEPFLFRASIAENIAYGRPDAAPAAVVDAARAANAHSFIARRANGYDMKLGEHGAGLSGGERQRISIARALLCDPRILVLDEATSSVDTESEMEIQKALAVLCRGRTTLAIAHRLSTLKNADRIFVIDEGRIAEDGSHEELMEKKGIYHKLVMIQTQLTRLEA
jgi:ATP-binding cassette subfamily B protein